MNYRTILASTLAVGSTLSVIAQGFTDYEITTSQGEKIHLAHEKGTIYAIYNEASPTVKIGDVDMRTQQVSNVDAGSFAVVERAIEAAKQPGGVQPYHGPASATQQAADAQPASTSPASSPDSIPAKYRAQYQNLKATANKLEFDIITSAEPFHVTLTSHISGTGGAGAAQQAGHEAAAVGRNMWKVLGGRNDLESMDPSKTKNYIEVNVNSSSAPAIFGLDGKPSGESMRRNRNVEGIVIQYKYIFAMVADEVKTTMQPQPVYVNTLYALAGKPIPADPSASSK